MILVLSHVGDDHAGRVLGELARRRHPAVLLDTAEFPQSIQLTQRFSQGTACFRANVSGRDIDLANCGAAWWRRPQAHVLHPGLDPDVAAFTYSECREAVEGMWAASTATWVNDPARDEAAHHKPYQLAMAVEIGLAIPKTLITNDPDDARAFVEEVGAERTVYKTFLATAEHWRETRIVRHEELSLLEQVRLAPVIFQEFVGAATDVRVTVIGDDLFPVEVTRGPGAYSIDYRVDLDGSTFTPATLPDAVAAGVLQLLSRLGLRYGAVDLLRTDDGYVFLEVNPAGEFLFVEDRTGLPLAATMASYLAQLDGDP